MQKRSMVSTILVVSILVTSSTGLRADDRLKKDRRRMAVGAVGVAASPLVFGLGVVSFNPIIAGTGVAMFGGGAGLMGVGGAGYISHKIEDRRAQEADSMAQAGPVEALVPVPQRPGYYYYPSNPNQLYVDQAQLAEPMPTKPETPALMIVKIANTAKDGRSIDCSVDGMRFSVPPGYTQTLAAVPGAVISYESGSGFARYTLIEGSYEFRSVENAWKFYNQAPARSVATRPAPTSPPQDASIPR